MELILDHNFIFNMYDLISVPNRHLIRQLLIYDCVNKSQVHFNLMKIVCVLYHVPIEYSSLAYVLNSLVTSYLKSVIDKSVSSTVLNHYLLGHPVSTQHDISGIIITGLYGCYLHNSQVLRFTHTAAIKPITCNIPVKVHVIKSENLKTTDSKKENFPCGDSDFKSFLLPLEQDYTKSSKGYNNHAMSIIDGVKSESPCDILSEDEYLQMNDVNNHKKDIPAEYEVNYSVQQNKFPQFSNALEDKSNNVTQQKLNQMKCLNKNNHSKITFNYSLEVFADHHSDSDNDSDSNDSIIFFEKSADEINETFIIHNLINCDSSDSDNDIISENELQINNGINVNKFWDSKIRDSSSDDELSNWDDDFDESASDLFQTLSLSFANDFSTASTCSQNNMYADNGPITTFGYVNACFEDDDVFNFDHITSINNNWNNTMKDVSSEPRQAKRVSFVPLPDLVSVYKFVPDNDGYCYSMYVFDQVRFQNRIQEFEAIIAPYLTSEHRAKVYFQNYQPQILP